MFVVFEGPDGSGKTTLAPMVADLLAPQGAIFCAKRTIPECPSFARKRMSDLRQILWPGGDIPNGRDLPPHYWLHLQAAWYGLMSEFVVRPLLATERLVLLDGWFYKNLAKAAMDGVNPELLKVVFESAVQPDLVVRLDLDLAAVFDRRSDFSMHEMGGYQTYETYGKHSYVDHQGKVMERLSGYVPTDRLVTVSLRASASPDENAAVLAEAIGQWLGRSGSPPATVTRDRGQDAAAGGAPECAYCPEGRARQPDAVAYEDTCAVLFPATEQVASNRGYSLLVPARHVSSLYDVPDDLAEPLMVRLQSAIGAVRRAFGVAGITVRQNNGPPGQHVFHLHFHVVPRYPGDGHDGFVPGLLDPVTDAERRDQARAIASALRAPGPLGAVDQTVTNSCPTCAGSAGDGPMAWFGETLCVPAISQRPDNLGEMWLMPRRHVEHLADLTPTEAGSLLRALRDSAIAVQRATAADGTTIRLHDGVPGQGVGHVRFQIVPRHLGDGFVSAHPHAVAVPTRQQQLRAFERELARAGRPPTKTHGSVS